VPAAIGFDYPFPGAADFMRGYVPARPQPVIVLHQRMFAPSSVGAGVDRDFGLLPFCYRPAREQVQPPTRPTSARNAGCGAFRPQCRSSTAKALKRETGRATNRGKLAVSARCWIRSMQGGCNWGARPPRQTICQTLYAVSLLPRSVRRNDRRRRARPDRRTTSTVHRGVCGRLNHEVRPTSKDLEPTHSPRAVHRGNRGHANSLVQRVARKSSRTGAGGDDLMRRSRPPRYQHSREGCQQQRPDAAAQPSRWQARRGEECRGPRVRDERAGLNRRGGSRRGSWTGQHAGAGPPPWRFA